MRYSKLLLPLLLPLLPPLLPEPAPPPSILAPACTASMPLGRPSDPETVIGPLASADQLRRVEEMVQDAVASGGEIVTGGERIDVVAEGPGRRIFIYPVENSKAPDLAEVLGQALGLPTTTARSACSR